MPKPAWRYARSSSATAPRLKPTDTAIHGSARASGRPAQGSAASPIDPAAYICAAIACGVSACALAAAFHPACSSALSSAAATSRLSIASQAARGYGDAWPAPARPVSTIGLHAQAFTGVPSGCALR
ncbi:MAG: hypothetical protein KIT28_08625 [Rubrivivax sp.]|nr:hypothetical protein [Rubrivivax sp.]